MADLSWQIISILVATGVLVGFINTLAGGATIISMTTFMALGLPMAVANGTNRIAVIFQNFTSAANFFKKKQLHFGVAWRLAIPTIIGNIVGSQIAVTVNDNIFKICLGLIFLFILGYLALSTDERLKGDGRSVFRVKPLHYIWFFLIGIYGGYIYVGIGYVILIVTLMTMKMDLVTANAVKSFVIFVATPFSLIIFLINGDVNIIFGLLHALGNVIGAYIASQWAVGWGARFIKIFMIIVILFCTADLFKLISIKNLLLTII